jgi:hypothetical protein
LLLRADAAADSRRLLVWQTWREDIPPTRIRRKARRESMTRQARKRGSSRKEGMRMKRMRKMHFSRAHAFSAADIFACQEAKKGGVPPYFAKSLRPGRTERARCPHIFDVP